MKNKETKEIRKARVQETENGRRFFTRIVKNKKRDLIERLESNIYNED